MMMTHFRFSQQEAALCPPDLAIHDKREALDRCVQTTNLHKGDSIIGKQKEEKKEYKWLKG